MLTRSEYLKQRVTVCKWLLRRSHGAFTFRRLLVGIFRISNHDTVRRLTKLKMLVLNSLLCYCKSASQGGFVRPLGHSFQLFLYILSYLERSRSFFIAAIAVVLTLGFAVPSPGQVLVTRQDVRHDVSPALRDLAKTTPAPADAEPREAEELHRIPLPDGFKAASEPDSVLQRATALSQETLTPAVIHNFDGIGQGVPPGFGVCCAPPDTNGAVGLTQYVQWVNLSFAVFDKATTSITLGPVSGNTLWSGFGGDCQTSNDGDPIVVYDKLADRWVFSQFVVHGGNGPFFQCVAVSTTSDATGSYNRYAFSYSSFDDYPKMGVWPDAYYETFNLFGPPPSFNFLGTEACAYDRNAMLNGQTATQICFQQGPSVEGLLPSDVDGHTPPPAGSPNFLMAFGVNSLNLFKFHVDFAIPANSTFTGPTAIPVAPFTPLCSGGSSCVPQAATATKLDSLADRLMYRLAYRNFGDHESLVANHSVAVSTSGGVRWYEIQNPNGTPQVVQQSTYAPDASFRWMGSIAMDSSGNIALGYSVSSSSLFPAVAFTTRAASDPASTLEAESNIIAGTGSQTGGLTRWGDYSAMQVDPIDDCTFWYTQEYLKTTGLFNWNTRIATFRFPSCGAPDLTVALSHTGSFTQSQSGKTYTITVTNGGLKSTDGSTVTLTDTLPTGLTATAASGTGWACTLGTPITCTRSDVLDTGASYPVITLTVNVANNAPGLVTNTATVAGGGEQYLGNDTANDPTTIIQTGPDLTIAKSHTGTFFLGQPGTYNITVTNVGLSPTDGSLVTVSDTLPTGLTATTATGTGWSCTPGATTTCTRSDILASNAAYPSITFTVSVANNAPASLTNTVTVAGGGDTNPLNNSASDPTGIIPPPPDLTVSKTHTGNFNQGQSSVVYTLTVTNQGAGVTSGTVTLTDNLPAGLSVTSMFGFGWNCPIATLNCTRSDVLAAGASYPPVNVTVNVANNAPALVINTAAVSGGGDTSPGNNTATDPTTINPAPDLTISMSHSPDPFTVGQTGTYRITVGNVGTGATSGTVTVNEFLPVGLIASAITATGWSCVPPLPTSLLICTRSDALAGGSSYPVITLTVNVVGGPLGGGSSVINSVGVNGGGEFNAANDGANDLTNINAPVLVITKSHVGNFIVGQTGTYTISVKNTGVAATLGTVTVSDTLPNGLPATSASGTGWSCSGILLVSCTRSDALAAGSSYPPITINVSVPAGLGGATNIAQLSGGGDSNFHSVDDPTIITAPPTGLSFVPVTPCRIVDTRVPNGSFGGPYLIAQTSRGFTIPNSSCNIPGTAQAYSLNVTVVPHSKLGFLTTFPCGQTQPLVSTLNSDGRIKAVATIVPAGTNGAVCFFVTDDTELILDIDGYFVPDGTPSSLSFYPVTPCRLVDTRLGVGPLGGPSLVGNGTARTFPLLSGPCNVPGTVQAYSLNYTSVPKGGLSFLTTWPTGLTQPVVSTLNAPTGAVTANAAIVPAGAGGAVQVFVTNDSDLVIDVNGYFAPPGAGGLSLFNLTPCRVLDTRNPAGSPPFSGAINVNVMNSGCGAPASAQSYVLNATVVPPAALGFLTLWPQGGTQPVVSTLNASDGAITSNMALVPTANGSISTFASNPSHLVLDISGYFASSTNAPIARGAGKAADANSNSTSGVVISKPDWSQTATSSLDVTAAAIALPVKPHSTAISAENPAALAGNGIALGVTAVVDGVRQSQRN
jgi:uncharacterized repeat protein (TIGR01451 family)